MNVGVPNSNRLLLSKTPIGYRLTYNIIYLCEVKINYCFIKTFKCSVNSVQWITQTLQPWTNISIFSDIIRHTFLGLWQFNTFNLVQETCDMAGPELLGASGKDRIEYKKKQKRMLNLMNHYKIL
jgi:hypothetical protein